MTDGAPCSTPADPARLRSAGPSPTIWLVSGVLAVSDAGLPAALHKLADHADLCGPGGPGTPVGGIIVHGRLKLAWSITIPAPEQLPALVEDPDPRASYRLLAITVTTFADGA